MYKIRPFLLFEIDNGYVLQNGEAITIVYIKELINFLKHIEENKISSITSDVIAENFKNMAEEITTFLVENKIFKLIEEPLLKFKNIFLIHNNEIFSTLFREVFSDLYKSINEINLLEKNIDFSNLQITSSDLSIIFLNPFNLNQYIKICDELIKTQTIIKAVFYYNNSFYVSNFYKKNWYNPCPKCFFYALESQLRGMMGVENTNFQTIMDLIYKKEPKFQLFKNVHIYELIPVFNILLNQLRFAFEDYNNVNDIYEVSLNSENINRDIAYHWEMCDCYD